MFFRRKPTPEITTDAFRRWLRAHRPPWQGFFALSELEQDQLATIGDEYSQDFAVAVGYAVVDPQVADAGISAAEGDTGAEETLVRRLAAGFAAKLAQQTAAPIAPPVDMPRESFAGFGERRHESHDDGKRKPRLFGREPDTPQEGTG